MKKLYADGCYHPKDEATNEYFLQLVNMEKSAKEAMNEDEFKSWVFCLHNYIREKLELPNKLLGLGYNSDFTKANIAVFPKEPDRNYYKIFIDEELKKPYILVNETNE